jgi:hypothetical protein
MKSNALLAPVSFSDQQLELLLAAAATIPVAQRDGFLRAVAASFDSNQAAQ